MTERSRRWRWFLEGRPKAATRLELSQAGAAPARTRTAKTDPVRALSRAMGVPVAGPRPVRVLGIDLGTTNSTVAELVVDPAGGLPEVRCLPVAQPTETGRVESVLVPSVVAVTEGGTWVGEGARRLRSRPSMLRNHDVFYECKNDIGLRRTYPRAPQGLRSAAEVGGTVLRFLVDAARSAGAEPDRLVVTVPASFQASQRGDTIAAARMAGFDLGPGDLLDEPVAAFIDHVAGCGGEGLFHGKPRNLLVFDFGGGTCDVVVFRVEPRPGGERLGIATLAVSRYHRLGGGDIDAVIVHDVLVPQLLQQAGLDAHALDYDARKLYLEPALLDVAESLKIRLCDELTRRKTLLGLATAGWAPAVATRAGAWPCPCPGHPGLVLKSPSLSTEAFAKVLAPFLDEELRYPKETDYHTTCSIFAPIDDAVARAGLDRREIDSVLVVGGSAMIPPVREALASHFPAARLLVHGDREAMQTAVARGAACQAMAIEAFGRGLVEPVSQDAIFIRTSTADVPVVPARVALPYPAAGGFREHHGLVVPRTALTGSVPLRVELVAGDDCRPVYARVWEIPAPVSRGDALLLRVGLDANQCLHFELSLRDAEAGDGLVGTVENPLAVVVDPSGARSRIEEAEEKLRTGQVPAKDKGVVLACLADDYAELGLLDKSVASLQQAIHADRRPNAAYLNRLGIRHGERRDWKRQEVAYREAARLDSKFSAPLFNLAHSQMKRGELVEAEKTALEAFAAEPNPSYATLHGRIVGQLGRVEEARRIVAKALGDFAPMALLNDFDLAWYLYGATFVADRARIDEAEAEQARRRVPKAPDPPAAGLLPEIAPGIRPR